LLSVVAIALANPLEDKTGPKTQVPVDQVKSHEDTKHQVPITRTNQQPQPASNVQKNTAPATNNANKQTWSRPAASPIDAVKSPQNVRVSRETSQKNVPTNRPAARQPVDTKTATESSQVTRKTRDTPKLNEAPKVTQPATNNDQHKKAPVNAQSPQVARVPLASTNARNKRDTREQTKTSTNANANTKIETVQVPSQQARDKPSSVTLTRETVQVSSKDQGPALHYPVPVSQVLKHKQSEQHDQKTVTEA
jgi:hypothetical protein